MPLQAGVVKEAAPGERRVALTPDAVRRLAGSGVEVLVESGAGDGAWFDDQQYAEAGATVLDAAALRRQADVLLCVDAPDLSTIPDGKAVIGLLAPLLRAQSMADLAARGVTAVSLDGLPRTLTRAQGMDALTSQTNIAGYKAVLVAAEHFDRFFPLLITAAGTSKPAEVLVLGAGVAGLSAIGTARRLGAVVRGYDVRPASNEEIRSLGAQPIALTSVAQGAGDGGYARALTDEEQRAQQAELAGHIAKHDVVITTAHVPGRRPPLMVTAGAIAAMRRGSVIVDMGASPLGGNVEGSAPGEVIVTGNGVTIVGASDLPSRMASAASAAYARNISALLVHLVSDGALTIDLTDEISAGVVITHDGRVVHPATAALLTQEGQP
ncbi:MAG TPA: NAD(P) transhydrogenase subunit alpha [Mycobacteriales bacterium]|nr:NAD(P) transhydrogenase subunit alpha [Mycobacteriales bacterium]